MKKYEEEYEVTKVILSELLNNYKGTFKWADDNNLSFLNNKKDEGTITLDNNKITVKGDIDKEFSKLLSILKSSEDKKLTITDTINTPFGNLQNDKIHFPGLETNRILFRVLLEELKKLNIKKIKVAGEYSPNDSIRTDLTLGISVSPTTNYISQPSGYYSRLKTFLADNYKLPISKSNIQFREHSKFGLLEKEKVVKITVKNMIVGTYYPERNFINLYFNPFSLQPISPFDKTVTPLINDILISLTALEIKVADVSDIQEKIFTSEFLRKARDKRNSLTSSIKEAKREISDYEKAIRTSIEKYSMRSGELVFINKFIETQGEGLFKEINKMKTLPFITKVSIEGSKIDIEYKETYIPIPDFKRNDNSKSFGKRYIYIGKVGFRITPDEFRVYGNVDIHGGHCHPHSSGFDNGSPCFGDGDGRNKIYDLLAVNNFYDMAKMLWFWVKTYKNDGAYVKVWDSYDNLLREGYPVFDEKGVRIKINDPVRIKSGEQVSLVKGSNYVSNSKAFKDVKLNM